MSEHANELQNRFADAAIALMMDQYAQEDGNALLQQYQKTSESMPELLDQRCQTIIQKAYKRTLIGSTLKRAARAAACILLLLSLCFPLAMSVEAFRIPVLNFILKHGKGFTQITFSQSASSFGALDEVRNLIWYAIPEDYRLEKEDVNTSKFQGTETVSSLLLRFKNDQNRVLEVFIMKAEGSLNLDSQDAVVTPMELYDQQAVFFASDDELRTVWVNKDQQQLYSVTGYGTGPDAFWQCVHTLSEATQKAAYDITF